MFRLFKMELHLHSALEDIMTAIKYCSVVLRWKVTDAYFLVASTSDRVGKSCLHAFISLSMGYFSINQAVMYLAVTTDCSLIMIK